MKLQVKLTKENILRKLVLNRIVTTSNCWLYNYGLHRTGYAYIMCSGKRYSIHRLSAWIHFDFNLNNKITKILHKIICPNKNCWNPEHLYI